MSGEEARSRFQDCKSQIDRLEFSNDAIVELGAIKLESEEIARRIGDTVYSKFCLNEIEQLDTDEFDDMFKYQDEGSFNSAKHELLFILDDCIRGHLA